MNEMIFGNTGSKDEGINISMDSSLYQKLQSKPYVPKLKSFLGGNLQEADKSFVYIGEMEDKSGKFTIYGYNAKLESDSRGGDFGNYIAVPVTGDIVKNDIDSVRFISESGFIEYINSKNISETNRFSVNARPCDSTENAKKKIVNNIMEMFARGKKSKNVTFSFNASNVDEFSEKSIGFMLEIMSYLPYCMRKNISFLSHICSKQKLTDLINFAAYDSTCEYKPYDCISLDDTTPLAYDAYFAAYIEKVFSMDAQKRDEYFKKLHTDIELPAIKAGVDVRSDLYLLDVSTKDFWANGDIDDVIVNVLSCVEDVLKVYPGYREIAVNRLSQSQAETREYLVGQINSCNNASELKPVFDNIISFLEVTGFAFKNDVYVTAVNKTGLFINSVTGDDAFIKEADAIVNISRECMNEKAAHDTIRRLFGAKSDLCSLYEFYEVIRQKNYINGEDLLICLNEAVENIILRATSMHSESKDKLSELEKIYAVFMENCVALNVAPVDEVYRRYRDKFSSVASDEAIHRADRVLKNINMNSSTRSTLYDNIEFIKLLGGLDVKSNPGISYNIATVYKKVSSNLFYLLEEASCSYKDIIYFIRETTGPVGNLTGNRIYDTQVQLNAYGESYIPDSVYRFIEMFTSLINALRESQKLSDALANYAHIRSQISIEEYRLIKIFDNIGPVVFYHWLLKHPKEATESNLAKAEKTIRKEYDGIRVPGTVKAQIRELVVKANREMGSSSKAKIIVIGAVAFVLIIALVFGGFLAWRFFTKGNNDKMSASDAEIVAMHNANCKKLEDYIAQIPDYKSLEINTVLAKLSLNEDGKYAVVVTNKLDENINESSFTATFAPFENSNMKPEMLESEPLNPETEYVIIFGKNGEEYIIYDIFDVANEQNIGSDANAEIKKAISEYVEFIENEQKSESDKETASDVKSDANADSGAAESGGEAGSEPVNGAQIAPTQQPVPQENNSEEVEG